MYAVTRENGRSSSMLLLISFIRPFSIEVPKANHMRISLHIASELKGMQLKCLVNLLSKPNIEGELMVP